MPAYTRGRASFTFFFIFLSVGMFFLLNVVVAVVSEQVLATRAGAIDRARCAQCPPMSAASNKIACCDCLL